MLYQEDFVLSFAAQVLVKTDGDDILLSKGGKSLRLTSPTEEKRFLIKLLVSAKENLFSIEKKLTQKFECFSFIAFRYFLLQLHQEKIFAFVLKDAENILVRLELMTENFVYQSFKITEEAWKFSSFAYVRFVDSCWLLESPLTSAKLWIEDPKILKFIACLAKNPSLKELKKSFEFSEAVFQALLNILYSMQAIELAAEENHCAEHWEFHDLVFHTRSRVGKHDYPSGGTFHCKGKINLPPTVKQNMSAELIQLFVPAIDKKCEPFFQDVLEERRSVREAGKNPLNIEQLGEFLYRSARIKEISQFKSPYETTRRPYAGGGALYGLELYLVINECNGIDPGFYYYQPEQHQLQKLKADSSKFSELTVRATANTGYNGFPNILIIVSVRFLRISWKYQAIAYATILKEVGALFQTFYLVATAMKLAPCAVGAGDINVFSEASGLNIYEETSVGEFLLSGL
jgi:SagB-type dehydrogenase family enzyme